MPAIMLLLSRMIMWLVSTYAGQWVLKILIALGISVTTTKVALPAILSIVQNYASGLSAQLYQVFGAIGFDVAITMILSAVVANATGKMIFRAVQK